MEGGKKSLNWACDKAVCDDEIQPKRSFHVKETRTKARFGGLVRLNNLGEK